MNSPVDETCSKTQRDPESYVKDRVQYKINVYARLGDRYKVIYWTLATTSAIGAALVPALVNLQKDNTILTTCVSLLVAISVSLERLYRPREHWRNYDLVSALLREEEMKFSTGSGPYSAGRLESGENPFGRFVERVEEAIHREREETILMRTGGDTRPEDTAPDERALPR